jgi:sugar lactone lactonase YvrE
MRPITQSAPRAAVLSLMLSLAACGGTDPCLDLAPGSVCTFAGTGEYGFNRDGKPARESDFYLLSAVRRGPNGRIHLMDFNNQRLRIIDDEGLVQSIAGNGFHAQADVSMPALDSPLENPIDFTFDPAGDLVFVSYHDPRVIRITGDGQLETLAGDGELGVRGDEGDFGDPLAARFIQLDGIAIAADGTIFVSDSLANRVRRIRDGVIETVAGTGRDGYAGDGGPATAAQLHWPSALELTPAGELLIADTRNHVVRVLRSDGTIETVAGTGAAGFAGDGGPATEAQLDQPYGLAIADDGTLYVADRENFRVRRVDPSGTIDTIAGNGENGFEGDGVPAIEASFGHLGRLALDADRDALLLADQSNSCARRIQLPVD